MKALAAVAGATALPAAARPLVEVSDQPAPPPPPDVSVSTYYDKPMPSQPGLWFRIPGGEWESAGPLLSLSLSRPVLRTMIPITPPLQGCVEYEPGELDTIDLEVCWDDDCDDVRRLMDEEIFADWCFRPSGGASFMDGIERVEFSALMVSWQMGPVSMDEAISMSAVHRPNDR